WRRGKGSVPAPTDASARRPVPPGRPDTLRGKGGNQVSPSGRSRQKPVPQADPRRYPVETDRGFSFFASCDLPYYARRGRTQAGLRQWQPCQLVQKRSEERRVGKERRC